LAYDHIFRAGNRADILKHVALLAAADTLAARHPRDRFVYADAFAGYACSPMVGSFGWEDGLGSLLKSQGEQSDDDGARVNPHLALFLRRYFAHTTITSDRSTWRDRPSLVSGIYPGSSLVAFDAIRRHGPTPDLRLFDISLAVIANLRAVFREHHATVVGSPAEPESPLLTDVDLLLIDPPGVRSPNDRSAPGWNELSALILSGAKSATPLLVWLPIMGDPNGETADSQSWRREIAARDPGVRTWTTQWKEAAPAHGGMLGTQLMWRLPQDAEAAVFAALESIRTQG